jgi:general secretion pathway protein L
VADALVVAGIIPDPLAGASEEPAESGAASAPDGESASTPESVVLYATREDWALVENDFQALSGQFASLKVQLLTDGPLPWLARDLPTTHAVNLLQGEFARSTDYGASWHRWRTAALLAGGLVAAHVAVAALQIHQANRESHRLDGEISEIFSQAMPSETLQDPRRQMESRLDRIRHSGPGPEYFLRTLYALGTALAQTPNTKIDSMSYREQALDMKVTAPNLAALSQLSQIVGKEGLTADIQSSTPTDGGVEAHMQVRSQGAKAHK